tara:strand:- start:93 stop:605 length:513 start_codon:yes stop_codon:yes gene_type:complete
METIRIRIKDYISKFMDNTKDVENTERAVFNATIQSCKKKGQLAFWTNPYFRAVYRMKAVSLLSNINPVGYCNNTSLLERFKADPSFKPHQLVFNSPDKLRPERWKLFHDHKRKKEETLKLAKEKCYTKQFVCPKCQATKSTYVELMTRSADEPMTLFVTCAVCNHQFRR